MASGKAERPRNLTCRRITYLSVAKKQSKLLFDMAKIQIKSEKLTPFGGILSIMEQLDSTLSSVIDSTLGLRYRSFTRWRN